MILLCDGRHLGVEIRVLFILTAGHKHTQPASSLILLSRSSGAERCHFESATFLQFGAALFRRAESLQQSRPIADPRATAPNALFLHFSVSSPFLHVGLVREVRQVSGSCARNLRKRIAKG